MARPSRPEWNGKMRVNKSKALGTTAAAIAVAAAVLAVPAQATSPPALAFSSLCGAKAGSRPYTVRHVMFILEENRSFPQVIGNPSVLGDPYINHVLVPSCGLATNYHNYSHPSLPNYLGLTSGTANGSASEADCSVFSNCPQSQASILSQLGNAGRSWREYAQSMPSNCYPGNDGYYLVRHAPPPYYTGSPVPPECKNWDVPLGTTTAGAFLSALSPTTDRLPAFSFVTPNACNDMHSCSTSTGDNWLKTWVPVIQRSAAYQSGQLVVFITWDEGKGADKVQGERCWSSTHANTSLYPSCWVATLVLSPFTEPGTRSGSYFNHLGLLGTAQDMLGLPRLAATGGYASLRKAFGL
jgi:phosphatidylinositol-3-phosphatase